MKRPNLLLACLAVIGLTAAVAWAAEETSWGVAKSTTELQPAAKGTAIPVAFTMVNWRGTVPDPQKNSGGNMQLYRGILCAWDIVGEDITGLLTLYSNQIHWNATPERGQEQFAFELEGTVNGVSGVFEGSAQTHGSGEYWWLNSGGEGAAAGVMSAKGTGGLAGYRLRACLVAISPVGLYWEGEVLAP